MIYERVEADEPIRQGDIFQNVPRVEMSLTKMPVVHGDETRLTSWQELLSEDGTQHGVPTVLAVKPEYGIVITQDCDATRASNISMALISTFAEATRLTEPTTPAKWASLLTKHARSELRWFYLPADPAFNINTRMAVDLRVLLRVSSADIEVLRRLRVTRLCQEACEHFRENIAQYFRRYPYDEWYPLTKDEFAGYSNRGDSGVTPRPWQT